VDSKATTTSSMATSTTGSSTSTSSSDESAPPPVQSTKRGKLTKRSQRKFTRVASKKSRSASSAKAPSPGSYMDIVNAARHNCKHKSALIQAIHYKCQVMQRMRSKRELKPGSFLGLVNVAATAESPREKIVVCRYHKQAMSEPYVADRPDAQVSN